MTSPLDRAREAQCSVWREVAINGTYVEAWHICIFALFVSLSEWLSICFLVLGTVSFPRSVWLSEYFLELNMLSQRRVNLM